MTPPSHISKKDVEVAYLERFRHAMPDFPEGKVEPSEEPDFLVWRHDSVLGIELTELHRETRPGASPQQARQSMRQRVINRAQEIYLANAQPDVRVTVFMHDDVHIERSEVEHLANQICELAIRNLPSPNSSSEEFYEWTNRAYFPDVVNNIRVHRLDAITDTHFNTPGSTWVAPLAPPDIERALLSKNPKYPTYRKRCDEAWLLINADIGSMSTWFQFDSESLASTFETDFERVFLFRHFGSKLHELTVRKPRVA